MRCFKYRFAIPILFSSIICGCGPSGLSIGKSEVIPVSEAILADVDRPSNFYIDVFKNNEAPSSFDTFFQQKGYATDLRQSFLPRKAGRNKEDVNAIYADAKFLQELSAKKEDDSEEIHFAVSFVGKNISELGYYRTVKNKNNYGPYWVQIKEKLLRDLNINDLTIFPDKLQRRNSTTIFIDEHGTLTADEHAAISIQVVTEECQEERVGFDLNEDKSSTASSYDDRVCKLTVSYKDKKAYPYRAMDELLTSSYTKAFGKPDCFERDKGCLDKLSYEDDQKIINMSKRKNQ